MASSNDHGDTPPPEPDPRADTHTSSPAKTSGETWGSWESGAPEGPAPPGSTVAPHPFGQAERGRYDRGQELGLGGMGRVLTARDRRLGRDVAMKEVAVHASHRRDAAARLAREAWITARLDHPAIVPVHDAGINDDGQLFYTMRLIRGETLADAMKGRQDLRSRLGLLRHFQDVCEAVAYAHAQGVVHRDLKPANVMVGAFGETQVVDWGLARMVDGASPAGDGTEAPIPELASHTGVGTVVGTPAYMSPEQARGEPADRQSDVWSLGAMLYELVSGHPPFEGSSSAKVLEAVRSAALPVLLARAPQVAPELAAISDRALQRAPEGRYKSALELATDLESFLSGRLVAAYDYTPWDHLGRFVRAWRVPLVAAFVALVAIVAAATVTYVRTAEERNRAVEAEARTRQALDRADGHLAQALLEQARQALRLEARAEAEVLAAHALALRESPEARGVLAAFAATARPERIHQAKAPTCAPRALDPRTGAVLCLADETVAYWPAGASEPSWSVPGSAPSALVTTDSVYLPEERGIRVLALSDGAEIARVDTSTSYRGSPIGAAELAPGVGVVLGYIVGAEILRPDALATVPFHPCPKNTNALALAVTEGGREVVIACSSGLIAVGGIDGELLRSWQTPFASVLPSVSAMVAIPGGTELLVGTERGTLARLDLATGQILSRVDTDVGSIHQLTLLPDHRVAARGERGGVQLWDLRTFARLERLPAIPGGHLAATDAGDLRHLSRRLDTWALPAREGIRRFDAGTGITTARTSPDGRWLATTVGDGSAIRWDPRNGARARLQLWDNVVAKAGAFNLDGRHYAAVAAYTGAHLVDTETWQEIPGLEDYESALRRVEWLTADRLLVAHYSSTLQAVDPGPPLVEHRLGALENSFFDLRLTADGAHGAALSELDELWRVDRDPEPTLTRLTAAAGMVSVAPSHDGRRIYVGTHGALRVHDGTTGELLASWPTDGLVLLDVVASPDGRWVAAGTLTGQVLLWSTADGVLRMVARAHEDRVVSVDFDQTRQVLVSGSWDGTALRWGLGPLDADPAVLVTQVESAWGMTLEDALAAELR